jgi:peptidoglycan/LPS O-acetylase OafA/YrhL
LTERPESRRDHRPDIDGLRAVAVGLVLLHHFDVAPFHGGFVGVDVFFVISGYLITRLIAADLDAGSFSFIAFYERRARRILPALLTMLAVTTIAALAILPPPELASFAAAVPPAILMYANIHMAGLTGYFGADARAVPLLHLWSVAVEEQFYLVYPLCLVALNRGLGQHWRRVIPIALALFAAYAFWHAMRSPSRGYYLTHDRAWELLLGAAAGLYGARLARQLAPLGRLPATAGLAAILTASLIYDGTSAFPGAAALLPCLGAALILIAPSPAHAAPFLSGSLATGLGRASYSIYLWHWPAIVLAGVVEPAPSPLLRLALGGFVVLAALASYHLVETPLRRPKGSAQRQVFAAGTGLTVAVLLGLAGLSASRPDWARPIDPSAATRLAAIAEDKARVNDCRVVSRTGTISPCRLGSTGAGDIYVLGDSFAGAVGLGLIDQPGRSVRLDTVPTCPPIPLTSNEADDYVGRSTGAACRFRNASLPDRIVNDPTISAVVLAGNWLLYPDRGTAASDPTRATYANLSRRVGQFAETLARRGKTVVLVGLIPKAAGNIKTTFGRTVAGWPAQLNVPRRAFDADNAALAPLFAAVSNRPNIVVVEPARHLCDTTTCFGVRDGEPLYFDEGHLSRYGAGRLAPEILGAIHRLALASPRPTN